MRVARPDVLLERRLGDGGVIRLGLRQHVADPNKKIASTMGLQPLSVGPSPAFAAAGGEGVRSEMSTVF